MTVDCQCNVHARRGFVELEASFPEQCRKVVESFSAIYRVEAQAEAAGLSAEQRLGVHQTHSQPVMEELRAWFTELIDGKKVEPNSGLGGAIAYMQARWTELTQFLRVPGARIDNSQAERILKMAILHRKNSLFYRTQRGAHVGDLFMSLVQTCGANAVNPFHYMMAVAAPKPIRLRGCHGTFSPPSQNPPPSHPEVPKSVLQVAKTSGGRPNPPRSSPLLTLAARTRL